MPTAHQPIVPMTNSSFVFQLTLNPIGNVKQIIIRRERIPSIKKFVNDVVSQPSRMASIGPISDAKNLLTSQWSGQIRTNTKARKSTKLYVIKNSSFFFKLKLSFLLVPNAGAETRETRQRLPVDSPAIC